MSLLNTYFLLQRFSRNSKGKCSPFEVGALCLTMALIPQGVVTIQSVKIDEFMLTCEDKLDDKRRHVSTSISSERPSGLRQSELRRWHCCWPLCASLCLSEALCASLGLWELALTGNLTGNSMASSSSVGSIQKMVGLYKGSHEAAEELQEAKKGSPVACSFHAQTLWASLCTYVCMYICTYLCTRKQGDLQH